MASEKQYRTFRGMDVEWTGDGVYVSYSPVTGGDYAEWVRTTDMGMVEQTLQQNRGIAWLTEADLDLEDAGDVVDGEPRYTQPAPAGLEPQPDAPVDGVVLEELEIGHVVSSVVLGERVFFTVSETKVERVLGRIVRVVSEDGMSEITLTQYEDLGQWRLEEG